MSFIDEVRNIAFDDDKERAIIIKLAKYKDTMRERYACIIHQLIKSQIKQYAAEGRIINNIISGEIRDYYTCWDYYSDEELSALPSEKLQEYINRGNSEKAFFIENSFGSIDIALMLMEDTVERKVGPVQKQIGFFYKRTQTVNQMNYYCKFFTAELTALINTVKEKCLNDGIKIEDVFFDVGFAPYNVCKYDFRRVIRIEDPIITMSGNINDPTHKYANDLKISLPRPIPLDKNWRENGPQIVFKHSFEM